MKRGRDRWAGPDYMYGFAPYVPVSARRAQAARRLGDLRKKGHLLAPVVINGRKIATTFWGRSWCDNLERYSDFANRLPRGRSYVRNGSVVDLQIAPGTVTARVSGSDLYHVRVTVETLPATRWQAVCRDLSGAIDSVVELLQGRLSDHVMARMCAQSTGLFPSPREIVFTCSCPDGAYMCKHVAAVLYGVGARLDSAPGLLFTLRQVQEADLIGGAGAQAAAALVTGRGRPGSRRIADEAGLSSVFGIDLDVPPPAPQAGSPPKPSAVTRPRTRKTSGTTARRQKTPRTKAVSAAPPAPVTPKARPLSKQARAFWAARKARKG